MFWLLPWNIQQNWRVSHLRRREKRRLYFKSFFWMKLPLTLGDSFSCFELLMFFHSMLSHVQDLKSSRQINLHGLHNCGVSYLGHFEFVSSRRWRHVEIESSWHSVPIRLHWVGFFPKHLSLRSRHCMQKLWTADHYARKVLTLLIG